MTKRFYLLNYNNFPIYDSLNDKEYNAQFKKQRENLCDLLNELSEEKQSVINWIDNKIEEIKPYNSELCRATLLELKEFLE